MTRYGTLTAGAVALFVAGWDLIKTGSDEANALALVMLTLGLVLIGAWLAVEIHYLWKEGGNHEDGYSDDADD
jgi:hypothetical protein